MWHCIGVSRLLLQEGVIIGGVVLGLAPGALAINAATNGPGAAPKPVPPLILSGKQTVRAPGAYSAGIGDIVQLLDARVDAQVILAYIQNSTVAYNPEASELIALKQHGASTEVLEALLHRGDQLRLQIAQALNTSNPGLAASVYDEPPAPVAAPDLGTPPPVAPSYTYGYGGSWLGGVSWWPAYRSYWFEHGRWHSRQNEARERCEENNRLGRGVGAFGLEARHPATSIQSHSRESLLGRHLNAGGGTPGGRSGGSAHK